MPRSSALRCAYVGCQNRTDRSTFGRIRTLSPDQLSSFSSWLKSPNDGVVCDYHYTLLRRLLSVLKTHQQAVVVSTLQGWTSC